ncbi:hypothetical protein [Geodermatophilus sp. SYSU D01036]
MIDDDQIAHDLAMAYVNNRHGAEVEGEFSVDSSNGDVTGSGRVTTERLPDVDEPHIEKVGTGERYFFGLFEKTTSVESGFEVDAIFTNMVDDYFKAKSKFLELLARRQPTPTASTDDLGPPPR